MREDAGAGGPDERELRGLDAADGWRRDRPAGSIVSPHRSACSSIQSSARSESPESGEPPPTFTCEPGNQTCSTCCPVLESPPSQSAGRNSFRRSST